MMSGNNPHRKFQTTKKDHNPIEPKQTSNPTSKPTNIPNPKNFKSTNQKPDYPTDTHPNYQPKQAPVQETANKEVTAARSKEQKPWYKKPVTWILASVIIVAIIILGLFLYFNSTKSSSPVAPAPKPEETSAKLTNKPKSKPKKASEDADTKEVDKNEPEKSERTWKNPGSYANMKYETDDFKIEIDNSSDGVKLISDTDNQPALYIRYTFTNTSDHELKPADIVNEDIQLKQNSENLTPSSNIEESEDKSRLDTAQQTVAPEQTAQVAMMYHVGNTKDQISMYFMNLKTKQPIATTQPFKL